MLFDFWHILMGVEGSRAISFKNCNSSDIVAIRQNEVLGSVGQPIVVNHPMLFAKDSEVSSIVVLRNSI